MRPNRTRAHNRSAVLAVCLALSSAVILLYGQVAGHAFINFDDDKYISENRHVLQGLTWDGVRWAFTTTSAGNWHPLTWLSHMLDAQLYEDRPGGHHLTNVALHALNAALLFLALLRLTTEFWPSAVVAAFFAVHPLRVESVAWAAERKDVLSGLFFLLTILAYAGYARRPTPGRAVAVGASLALSLMAKPMAVTIPFVLLLLDVWPLGRLRLARGEGSGARAFRTVVLEKLPLVALAVASSAITLVAQHRGGAVSSFRAVPFAERLANAAVSYLSYLRKAVSPLDLAVFYPHPAMTSSSTGILEALGAWLLLGVVTVLALRAAPRWPYIAVGWLWYLGTLLPVIGLVQVGRQALADRYTYLPLIGVTLVAVWGARDLARAHPRSRVLLAMATAAALAACMAATWRQVGYWKDGISLYRHALEVTRGNDLVHNNLGVTLFQRGRYGEAVAEYEEALRIRPDDADAHINYGLALKNLGKLSEAEAHFKTAIRLRPDYPEAHHNLGNMLEARGDYEQAKVQYEAALKIDPDYSYALLGLGTVLAKQDDLDGAERQLKRAVRLDPRRMEIRKNLGIVFMMQGKADEAAEQFEEAVRLRPEDPELRNEFGVVRMQQGRLVEAEGIFERVLEIRPGLADAHANLALLFERQGRTAEALAHRREAERLRALPR